MNTAAQPTAAPTIAKRDVSAQFVGEIPQAYDTCLGPLLFEFSAADTARRVSALAPKEATLLEVACGTGISTEHLWRALPSDTQILATDLNPAMLEFAKQKRGTLAGVRYQQADALDLPFADNTFDVVVCQFGIMFFPDKIRGIREMARVLRPGGSLVFTVWESTKHNRVAGIAKETVDSFFETDPPEFLSVPFGYSDVATINNLLQQAELQQSDVQVVSDTITGCNARDIARGFVEGNPTIIEIKQRARVDINEVIDAVAEAIDNAFGPSELAIPLREIVFTARKPTN